MIFWSMHTILYISVSSWFNIKSIKSEKGCFFFTVSKVTVQLCHGFPECFCLSGMIKRLNVHWLPEKWAWFEVKKNFERRNLTVKIPKRGQEHETPKTDCVPEQAQPLRGCTLGCCHFLQNMINCFVVKKKRSSRVMRGKKTSTRTSFLRKKLACTIKVATIATSLSVTVIIVR